ncbi:MAG: GNAT family N-acetyltransferase, partial [Hyphomonadaceae bacterium]|nr:GNAT family N-acetyltransferase [Hyphomonadaceae bacterium]
WFVGERAGAVIASTRWTELALGPSFKPARVGLLATVVVAASARGRGYGQRLIAHALEDMRAQGIEHAWLEVVHDNDPATRLYAAAGFVPFEIAMVKPLGDA